MFMYKLKHELSGDVICESSLDVCKAVLAGFVKYGIREDKFSIVCEDVKWMSEDLRDKVKTILFHDLYGVMFGDGLEDDYITRGMSFVGLDNMSDDELFEEMEHFGYTLPEDEDDADDELSRLIIEMNSQKAVYELLTT